MKIQVEFFKGETLEMDETVTELEAASLVIAELRNLWESGTETTIRLSLAPETSSDIGTIAIRSSR